MRSGKELMGKLVISLTDGRSLGVVKDLYLDENLQAVAGIYLGGEGFFSRRARLIAHENVVIYGIDAILVKNADVVTDNEIFTAAADWIRLEKLRGREIDTPGGTKVATVGDVLIDEEGRVLQFSLGRTYIEGPVASRGTIARDVMIDTGNKDGAMTIDLARAEKPAAGE
jgi:sporulation protein YlmC with PRC-barrel domain